MERGSDSDGDEEASDHDLDYSSDDDFEGNILRFMTEKQGLQPSGEAALSDDEHFANDLSSDSDSDGA
eukprot:7204885-Karenia_brevis.AAC.1